ncbi:hypothetical protein FB451DRAFT_1176782 [Mycena latifolia]|nr:hypothetical protein FB451DRAFT_1176782 [Mycena latifolia]
MYRQLDHELLILLQTSAHLLTGVNFDNDKNCSLLLLSVCLAAKRRGVWREKAERKDQLADGLHPRILSRREFRDKSRQRIMMHDLVPGKTPQASILALECMTACGAACLSQMTQEPIKILMEAFRVKKYLVKTEHTLSPVTRLPTGQARAETNKLSLREEVRINDARFLEAATSGPNKAEAREVETRAGSRVRARATKENGQKYSGLILYNYQVIIQFRGGVKETEYKRRGTRWEIWVDLRQNSPLRRTYDTDIHDKAGKWAKAVSLKTKTYRKDHSHLTNTKTVKE